MTRKHFKAIAAILKEYKQSKNFDSLITDLNIYFRSVNQNFQADKFREAVEE